LFSALQLGGKGPVKSGKWYIQLLVEFVRFAPWMMAKIPQYLYFACLLTLIHADVVRFVKLPHDLLGAYLEMEALFSLAPKILVSWVDASRCWEMGP
jgi:hypothetical protein